MTRKLLFDIVMLGAFALPLALALILVALPRPRSSVVRSVIAIATAWAVSVVYTIHLYNPAGIAAGRELGLDSPEMKFDNNTVGSQLLGGWMYPSLVVALFFVARHLRSRQKANSREMIS
jgi:hypothetical protein